MAKRATTKKASVPVSAPAVTAVVSVPDNNAELVALRDFYDAVAKHVAAPPLWTEQMRQSLHEIARLVAAHHKTFTKAPAVPVVAPEQTKTTVESSAIQSAQTAATESTGDNEDETRDTSAEDFPADPEEDAAEAAEAERS